MTEQRWRVSSSLASGIASHQSPVVGSLDWTTFGIFCRFGGDSHNVYVVTITTDLTKTKFTTQANTLQEFSLVYCSWLTEQRTVSWMMGQTLIGVFTFFTWWSKQHQSFILTYGIFIWIGGSVAARSPENMVSDRLSITGRLFTIMRLYLTCYLDLLGLSKPWLTLTATPGFKVCGMARL
jgi:hypothetical protein